MILRTPIGTILAARHDHGPDYPGSRVPLLERMRDDYTTGKPARYQYAVRSFGVCIVIDPHARGTLHVFGSAS